MRIAILGNSGGGKSSLARAVAAARGLPHVELDALLWRQGWRLVEAADYEAAHQRAIAAPAWVMDGLGRRESIPDRLARASGIVLVDMPLAVHLRLAEQRHRAWQAGRLAHPPAGLAEAPPLAALLRTIEEVDRDWMPDIRRWAEAAAARGTKLRRIASLPALEEASRAAAQLLPSQA
jgi:adenylate kinase family enzyme